MCKLSKFFSFCFTFSLLSGFCITSAKKDISAGSQKKDCNVNLNKNKNKKAASNEQTKNQTMKSTNDKRTKQSDVSAGSQKKDCNVNLSKNNRVAGNEQTKKQMMKNTKDKKTKQFDISSLPEETLGLIKQSCADVFKEFLSSIIDFKKNSKDKNAKKIIKFLGDCKFTFENNQGLIINVYPKNIFSEDYTLDNIANLNIGNYIVKFNLAKSSSPSDEKKSFDISSLSTTEIKKMFRPYLKYIKDILADILDLKDMLSNYKDIANYLSSCKFSFEKDSSSKKSIFKFNIYPDDFIENESANIKTILDIDLDKKSSVEFNLVKKNKVSENVKS